MAQLFERRGRRAGDSADLRWFVVPIPELLRATIRGVLLNALAYTNGRGDKAAVLLGIGPRVMSDMMRRYAIPRPIADRPGARRTRRRQKKGRLTP